MLVVWSSISCEGYHLGAAGAADSSYGPHATQPDTITDEELQRICDEYLSSMTVTQ